jgi:tetratricopeptide (TPR) repeat protein
MPASVRMRHLGRVLLVAAGLFASIGHASAQTQITDATVDELLQRAQDAYRRGRADETAALLHRVSDWANHIRDVAAGSAKPAEDLAFAERIYRRVLATFGQTLGADHDHAGSALMGLAGLYIDQQRYAEAEPLLRRTLGIAESAYAPSEDHRQAAIGRVVGQLGMLAERQGRNSEAEAYYRRALAIVDKLPPRFRNATGKSVQYYLRFLRENNRAQEAAAIETRLTR